MPKNITLLGVAPGKKPKLNKHSASTWVRSLESGVDTKQKIKLVKISENTIFLISTSEFWYFVQIGKKNIGI